MEEKWSYIVGLDDTLLHGGVTISEYIMELIRNADISFVHGAYLSSIITSIAAIEGYFRLESNNYKEVLFNLINKADISKEDIDLIHKIRKYRNQIVHANDIWEDEELLDLYDDFINDQECIAKEALRLLRIVVYSNPWI